MSECRRHVGQHRGQRWGRREKRTTTLSIPQPHPSSSVRKPSHMVFQIQPRTGRSPFKHPVPVTIPMIQGAFSEAICISAIMDHRRFVFRRCSSLNCRCSPAHPRTTTRIPRGMTHGEKPARLTTGGSSGQLCPPSIALQHGDMTKPRSFLEAQPRDPTPHRGTRPVARAARAEPYSSPVRGPSCPCGGGRTAPRWAGGANGSRI